MRALVLTFAIALLVSAQPAPAAAPCIAREVEGQGPSCPVEAGWLVTLPDGARLLTHGPDAAPDAVAVHLPSASPACAAGADDFALRVLHVVPPATLDPGAPRVALIRAGAAAMTGVMLESALPLGADVRPKFFCDDAGEVEVTRVRVATPTLRASFATLVADVRAQGFDRPNEKYLLLYEGFVLCECIGQGQVHDDDRALEENAYNTGPMYAAVYLANHGAGAATGTLSKAMLHEAGHILGAVQLSAPHSTGQWHCTDGRDVMCYPDGSAARYDAGACPRIPVSEVGPELPFDCGNDDYFHPLPPAGSYLADHWNVGAPLNRFVAWSRV